ncbi:hypothetical protein [Cohnella sp.]|uniref:hypothetical protein n=1 Tax=Cohnella sp. TaxID=1883426 RepID=UPI003567E247
MVIPSQGKNKLLAWKFIEWALATKEGNEVWINHGGIPGYIPAFELDSFKNGTYKATGDQKVNELSAKLIPQVQDNWFDIQLNDAAKTIWDDSIGKAIEKNSDSKAALQQIQDDIMKAVKPDLDRLKSQLGIQ